MVLAVALSLASHGFGIAAFDQLPFRDPAGTKGTTAGAPDALRVEVRSTAQAERPPLAHVQAQSKTGSAGSTAKRVVEDRKAAYYPAHLLDERPQVRVHVDPIFPAHTTQDEARVRLRLFISEEGLVDEVAVLEGEAPPAFQVAATSAFARALFTPGRVAGRAVKSTLAIEVLFGAPVPMSAPHARADAPR